MNIPKMWAIALFFIVGIPYIILAYTDKPPITKRGGYIQQIAIIISIVVGIVVLINWFAEWWHK